MRLESDPCHAFRPPTPERERRNHPAHSHHTSLLCAVAVPVRAGPRRAVGLEPDETGLSASSSLAGRDGRARAREVWDARGKDPRVPIAVRGCRLGETVGRGRRRFSSKKSARGQGVCGRGGTRREGPFCLVRRFLL